MRRLRDLAHRSAYSDRASGVPTLGERRAPIQEAAERANDERYRQWAEAREHHPPGNPPSSRLLDARIDELAAKFPEYSSAELAQAEIDADARRSWNAETYPPYVGPGYTVPPMNWRGPWSEHEKDDYWNPEPEAGA